MRKIILTTVCALFLTNLYSQQVEESKIKLFPLSPQAGSLGQYGELPIDLSTGKINYTIPIYTIKVGDFEYPIQLSYNYNGYRPEDIPSNVGYGWSINTAGYISTQVRGLCDFSGRGYQRSANDYLIPYLTNRWNIELSPTQANEKLKLYYRLSTEGEIDNEPDKFAVNAGKLNFSFYLDENAKALYLPKTNNIVNLGYNNFDPLFNITDDFGNLYKFGLIEKTENQGSSDRVDIANSGYNLTEVITKSNNSILFSYTPKYRNIRSYVNTLKKCILNTKRPPSGQGSGTNLQQTDSHITYNQIKEIKFIQGKIEFLYDNNIDSQDSRLEYIIVKNNQEQIIEKYQFVYDNNKNLLLKVNKISNTNTINVGEFDYYGEFPNGNNVFSNDYWGYYNGKNNSSYLTGDHSLNFDATITGALKSIKYPTKGKTIIEYEQNEAIGSETNTISDCNKIQFQKHDQLTAISDQSNNFITSNLEKRVYIPFKQMIKVTLVAHSDVTIPQVNNGEAIARASIRRASGEIKVLNCQNYGFNEYDIYQAYSFRDFNLHGLLDSRVIYIDCEPGEIILSLEVSNMMQGESIAYFYVDYDDTIVPNVKAGGVRVKKVSTLQDNNQTIFREFSYLKDDGKTSGSSFFTAIKKYYNIINLTSPPAVQIDNGYNSLETWRYETIVGQTSLPFANYNGNPVIYSQVIENFNSQNSNNGYIIHKFNGSSEHLGMPIDRQINLPLDNIYISLGKKIEEKTFDNLSKCVKSSNTVYEIVNDSERKINGLKINRPIINLSYIQIPGSSGIDDGSYQIIETLNTSEYATYPYFFKEYSDLPMEIRNKNILNNNPVETKTQFLYNSNHQLKSEKTIFDNNVFKEIKYFYPQDIEMINQPFLNDLIAKNMIRIPLAVEKFNNTNKLLEQKTIYAKDATTNNLLLPKNIYSANFPNALPILPNNIGQLENKITYNQYDDKGNIQQYTPESGTPVSIIWGYNKTQPIAKIENATYTQIQSYESNLQTLSNTGTEANLITALNTLRTNLPNAMITTYTHKPLVGVSTITDPKGIQVSYTYDTFGRLQFVKDKDGNTLSENDYHYKN